MPRTAVIRLSALLVLLFVQACATKPPASSAPLPALQHLPCCWLTEEKIELQNSGRQSASFIALLNRSKDQLSLIVLDPLGRRVLQASRHADGFELQHDLSEGRIPLQSLWLAIHLVHFSELAWPLAGTEWSLTATKQSAELRYRGNKQAVVSELAGGPLSDPTKPTKLVEFSGENTRLKVSLLRRTPL